jgi:mono/diheme cytochrome c family protein
MSANAERTRIRWYDGWHMHARKPFSLLALFVGIVSRGAAMVAWAMGCAALLSGCRSLPPSKPASEWTEQEARGAQVYQAKCARCHYPSTTQPLHGPGLQALTKLKAMPSGAPPTDERLTAVILHGRQMMPGTQLTDEQLSDLLAYLHTL